MSAVGEATALDAAQRVVAALDEEPTAVYVVGSVALGAFEPGRSDLDMVAVFDRRLSDAEKHALARRVLEVDVTPARQLELVAYAGGELALNVNSDPVLVELDPPRETRFWFVLDRAIAQQAAVAVAGPEWNEVFEPVPRTEVLAALAASLDWHSEETPGDANTVLNALRGWRYLETGDWVSKPEAARWLHERVAGEIERAR